MSIEFVDPEPARARVGGDPVAGRPAPPSGVPGRVLTAAAVVAAALVAVAVRVQLYVVDKTSFVVDFDGTTTQRARVPYDAFGHTRTARVTVGASGGTPGGGGGAYASSLTVSRPDGIAYAPWWLAVAGLLVLLAVWAVVRPRSSRPGAAVAAVGGVLLGSVGAAWLGIRAVDAENVPQIVYAAHPGVGLWLLVAAGGVALVAGGVAATRPSFRRPGRRHDRRDVHDSEAFGA